VVELVRRLSRAFHMLRVRGLYWAWVALRTPSEEVVDDGR